ncbi:MAG: LD-carboxypeptidase [bacterium]|nr:LD-carboxypeptidase [bacterium]
MSAKMLSGLEPGAEIAFAAPAHAVPPAVVRLGRDLFEGHGFRVRAAENATHDEDDDVLHKLAGPDEWRIQETNRLFNDPSVEAICCLTGGYGVMRILDRLDFAALKKHPKVVCGFSDITALHSAIYAKTGMSSLHSPNVDSAPLHPLTESAWFAALRGFPVEAPSELVASMCDDSPMETWRGGEAEGVLLGGNLTLVSALMGTPYAFPRDRDVILFIEDVGEFAYRIDLMLLQLWMAGAFQRVKGLMLGRFRKRERQQNEEAPGLLEDVMKLFRQRLKIPILANVPFGHVKLNLTLVHGASIRLNADEQSWRYIESDRSGKGNHEKRRAG